MSFTRRRLFATGLASLAALPLLHADEKELPAYHKDPPTGPLPETKDPKIYANKPVVMRIYELAGKVRPVLYQLPCYCSCDKFAGHGSLLDCFVDAHGEECGVCQREAVMAYKLTKAGVSVKSIRAQIVAGKWQKVDISPAALAEL